MLFRSINGIPSSVGQVNGKRKAEVLDDDDGEEEVETGKKGRKKAARKPKDPNAPKRPPSSYLLFQNEIRNDLKEKFPDVPHSELLKMIASRWAALSEVEKQVSHGCYIDSRILSMGSLSRNIMPRRLMRKTLTMSKRLSMTLLEVLQPSMRPKNLSPLSPRYITLNLFCYDMLK